MPPKRETVDAKLDIGCVSVPERWVYLPQHPAKNRPALMICPGGGFGHLAMGVHVRNLVKLANDQGMVVIGLKYRTAYGGQQFREGFAGRLRANGPAHPTSCEGMGN